MAFFEFPHTRTYDSDLGWLIHAFNEISKKLDEYLENAVITFADPITWDITAQYPAMTCVIDSDGTAYLSKQPVPAGVPITNTNYWLPIFNYDDNINQLRSQIAYNARDNATTAVPLVVGDLVFWSGIIYKVIADMPAGSAFVDGTNVTQYTVSDRIQDVAGDLTTLSGTVTTEVARLDAADVAINLRIDNLPQEYHYITPEDFGAVGDDIADDSAAFQAMFNAVQEGDVIMLTSPKYRVDSPLVCNASGVRITAYGRSEYWPAIITSMGSGTLLTINGGGWGISNISIRGRYAPTPGGTLSLLTINANTLDLDGNVDAYITNCHFLYGNYGINAVGRNCHIDNCLINGCEIGVQFTETTIATENRGHSIRNCYFHGITNYCIYNLVQQTHGYNRLYMSFMGNVADLCRAFYYGYGGGIQITDNYIFCFGVNSQAIIINIMPDNINPSLYENVIANNHIVGQTTNGNLGIALGDGIKAQVINNVIENTQRDGIRIGVGSDVVCNGNILNGCGTESGQYPIMIKTTAKGVVAFNVLQHTSKIIYQTSGHTMTVQDNITYT